MKKEEYKVHPSGNAKCNKCGAEFFVDADRVGDHYCNKTIFKSRICFIKTIWRTLQRPVSFIDGVYISGHDYVEQENGELICKMCGDKI